MSPYAPTEQADISEVTLMLGPLPEAAIRGASRPRHLTEVVSLGADLWIGPHLLAERVIAACQPRGENWTPRHEWSMYAFWRDGAPYAEHGSIRFDVDRRLSNCIQLSRLVRPTSIGFSRAARLITWPDQRFEIVPAEYQGRGSIAFVANPEQDWIRDTDIEPIRQLVSMFRPDSLPDRVKRAMLYYEFAHGLHELDVRWPIIVTAAEALVHTDERRKTYGPGGMRVTDQFTKRLAKLADLVECVDWDEAYLEDAYEHRSSFAHGRGLNGVPEGESVEMYRRLESGLRAALCAAILDPAVARIFETEGSVREHLNPGT